MAKQGKEINEGEILKHTCHLPGCRDECPPKYLMCLTHWKMVSKNTQNEVYRTVKLRDKRSIDKTWAEWWKCQAMAIHEVLLQYPDKRELANNLLKRELDFVNHLKNK